MVRLIGQVTNTDRSRFVTPQDFALQWQDGQGAVGATGLTLHAFAIGKPDASLTLAGYTTANLFNGRLHVSYGAIGNETYMLIQGVQTRHPNSCCIG